MLQDWNRGKLRYHTLPPAEEKFARVLESTVVDRLGPAFQLFPSANPRGAAADDLDAATAAAGGVSEEEVDDEESEGRGAMQTDEQGEAAGAVRDQDRRCSL